MSSEISSINESFYQEIRTALDKARNTVHQAVNTAMVQTYWYIGQKIVEEEQNGSAKAKYGQHLIKQLSQRLSQDFGSGFSVANLKNFRQFYLTYVNDEELSKRYTLCSQLSWSHNRLIMRVKDPEARDYYLTEAYKQNWSTRTLDRHISTQYYQRLLSTPSAEQALATPQDVTKPQDFIKNPAVLEFLNLPTHLSYNERDLEKALIDDIQSFLLELGKGFAFVERQQLVRTESSDFYIDLVFYNYLLKCFVIIELKTEKLKHEHIGQLDMYVRMYDDLKRNEGDNPTIGLLLCTDTDETIAKYSVLNESKQIFASKYLTYLPSEAELSAEIERQKQVLKEHRLNNGDEA